MRKYSYTQKKTIMRNPMRFENKHLFRVLNDNDSQSSFFNYDNDCNTIEEYLLNNQDIVNFEGVGLNDEELSAILLANKNSIQTVSLISENITDLSAFACCKALKSLKVVSMASLLTVWDASQNTQLQSLKLELPSCKQLNNLSGLENSCLQELIIVGYERKIPDLTLFALNDISFLKTLKSLKKLSLYTPFEIEKGKLLTEFSYFTWLEELNLPKDCFTFKEFAWLSSKLENVKGLSAFLTYYKDHRRDVHMFVIIGSDTPDVEDERSFIEEYECYKEEFKHLDTPPID